MGLPKLFIPATVFTAAGVGFDMIGNIAPSAYPHAPQWVWEYMFWGSVVLFSALPLWVLVTAIIWAVRATGSFGWLSLEAAAQHVYDKTRHSGVSRLSRVQEGRTATDPRQNIANIVFHWAAARGKLRGATYYDLISAEDRARMYVNDDMHSVGKIGDLRPHYFHVQVKRSDLSDVIARIEELEKVKL
jgi:hypothetical protein